MPPLNLTTLAILLSTSLASAQIVPPGVTCPKQTEESPSFVKPKNCPDRKSIPDVNGSLKDNACLTGGIMGGDFFNACYAPSIASSLPSLVSGSKDGGGSNKAKQDWSGGSGPYNAQFYTDPSLPLHTIYAPKTPVPGRKLPLLMWGNGACGTDGSGFSNFLTEIASHGFMVIANGAPKLKWGEKKSTTGSGLLGSTSGEKSRAIGLTYAVDWAEKGAANGKYGEVDMQKVGVAGQSCGGVEAYSASVFDPRVKVIGIYNTGVIDPGRRHYLKDIKQPIGYFYGGDTDFSKSYIEEDFTEIPAALPAIKSVLQTGHMGTYFEVQGGKFGVISVAFWKWQLQADQASKALFFNTSSVLYKDNWKIDTSHWK